MSTAWHTSHLLAFDTETTGVDIETDRIVTAASIDLIPQLAGPWDVIPTTWLAAVDVDIPEVATEIHGITTDHARTHGKPPAQVVHDITTNLASALGADVPVIGMNVCFDLSILDRECRRHNIPTLSQRLGHEPAPIIDVRVIDKHLDRYRRGGRRLDDLCGHYAVTIDEAHDASQDALAAARVAWKIAARYSDIRGMTPSELHEKQKKWAAEQAKSFANYLCRIGETERADQIDGSWPLRPAAVQQQQFDLPVRRQVDLPTAAASRATSSAEQVMTR